MHSVLKTTEICLILLSLRQKNFLKTSWYNQIIQTEISKIVVESTYPVAVLLFTTMIAENHVVNITSSKANRSYS